MKKILLVEDDELLRHSLRLGLIKNGYDVVEARDGREALIVHAAVPADVVVTDLVMPGQEGVETIMEFRQRYPALPVVAMSGGGAGPAGTYLRIASHLGACQVLAKPFTIDQLVWAIEAALRRA